MTTIRALLIEDNEGDAVYLKRLLSRTTEAVVDTSWVVSLLAGLQAASLRAYDVALVDLSLPDSQGIDTVVEFLRQFPTIPMVVMTGHDDMRTAVNCVRCGAQDYLIKGKIDARALELTVVTAIERKRADLTSKRLMYKSLATFDTGSDTETSAAVSMMRTHNQGLAAALRDIRKYLANNAPGLVEGSDAILKKHEVPLILREMNEILHFDADGEKTPPRGIRQRRITEKAMRAVSSIVDDTEGMGGRMPSDPPEANAALLDIISRNTSKDPDDRA